MIKGVLSASGQKRIDLTLLQGPRVPFPTPGSGWFGLYLVSGGACVVRFGGSRGRGFTLDADSLLCLDDSVSVCVTEAEPGCTFTALCFKPTFLNVNMERDALFSERFRQLADRHGLFKLESFISHSPRERMMTLNPEAAALLSHSLDRIRALLVEPDDWYWSCRIRSHFMDILAYMDEQRTRARDTEPDAETAQFAAMTAVIRDNLEEPLSVEGMTLRFGVNRNKLQTLFHRFAECSYLAYVQNVRLERAKYCLRFTELSLPEIAARTGFRTTHNFSRFFKQETGESATAYRTRTVAERKKDFISC